MKPQENNQIPYSPSRQTLQDENSTVLARRKFAELIQLQFRNIAVIFKL